MKNIFKFIPEVKDPGGLHPEYILVLKYIKFYRSSFSFASFLFLTDEPHQVKPITSKKLYIWAMTNIDRINGELTKVGLECKTGKIDQNSISAYVVIESEHMGFVYARRYEDKLRKLYPDFEIFIFNKTDRDEDKEVKTILYYLDIYTDGFKKHYTPPKKKVKLDVLDERSFELRERETKYEELFKKNLTTMGIPFSEQVVVHPFICDFLLFGRIVVEIDGGYHSLSEQYQKDIDRTKILNKKGYLVLRCTNQEVSEWKFKDPLLAHLLQPFKKNLYI